MDDSDEGSCCTTCYGVLTGDSITCRGTAERHSLCLACFVAYVAAESAAGGAVERAAHNGAGGTTVPGNLPCPGFATGCDDGALEVIGNPGALAALAKQPSVMAGYVAARERSAVAAVAATERRVAEAGDRFFDRDEVVLAAIRAAITEGLSVPCPGGCGARCRKDTACIHMLCSKCGTKFCYACGQKRADCAGSTRCDKDTRYLHHAAWAADVSSDGGHDAYRERVLRVFHVLLASFYVSVVRDVVTAEAFDAAVKKDPSVLTSVLTGDSDNTNIVPTTSAPPLMGAAASDPRIRDLCTSLRREAVLRAVRSVRGFEQYAHVGTGAGAGAGAGAGSSVSLPATESPPGASSSAVAKFREVTLCEDDDVCALYVAAYPSLETAVMRYLRDHDTPDVVVGDLVKGYNVSVGRVVAVEPSRTRPFLVRNCLTGHIRRFRSVLPVPSLRLGDAVPDVRVVTLSTKRARQVLGDVWSEDLAAACGREFTIQRVEFLGDSSVIDCVVVDNYLRLPAEMLLRVSLPVASIVRVARSTRIGAVREVAAGRRLVRVQGEDGFGNPFHDWFDTADLLAVRPLALDDAACGYGRPVWIRSSAAVLPVDFSGMAGTIADVYRLDGSVGVRFKDRGVHRFSVDMCAPRAKNLVFALLGQIARLQDGTPVHVHVADNAKRKLLVNELFPNGRTNIPVEAEDLTLATVPHTPLLLPGSCVYAIGRGVHADLQCKLLQVRGTSGSDLLVIPVADKGAKLRRLSRDRCTLPEPLPEGALVCPAFPVGTTRRGFVASTDDAYSASLTVHWFGGEQETVERWTICPAARCASVTLGAYVRVHGAAVLQDVMSAGGILGERACTLRHLALARGVVLGIESATEARVYLERERTTFLLPVSALACDISIPPIYVHGELVRLETGDLGHVVSSRVGDVIVERMWPPGQEVVLLAREVCHPAPATFADLHPGQFVAVLSGAQLMRQCSGTSCRPDDVLDRCKGMLGRVLMRNSVSDEVLVRFFDGSSEEYVPIGCCTLQHSVFEGSTERLDAGDEDAAELPDGCLVRMPTGALAVAVGRDCAVPCAHGGGVGDPVRFAPGVLTRVPSRVPDERWAGRFVRVVRPSAHWDLARVAFVDVGSRRLVLQFADGTCVAELGTRVANDVAPKEDGPWEHLPLEGDVVRSALDGALGVIHFAVSCEDVSAVVHFPEDRGGALRLNGSDLASAVTLARPMVFKQPLKRDQRVFVVHRRRLRTFSTFSYSGCPVRFLFWKIRGDVAVVQRMDGTGHAEVSYLDMVVER